ncbi:[FeFe] hydrogenase H-cluster radical SAM maturase HydG [Natronospora cellulosivora (SeqCode)]
MTFNYWEKDFGDNYRAAVCDYITDKKVEDILTEAANSNELEIRTIIKKALDLKGITPLEAAKLLQVDDDDLIDEYLEAAKKIKEKIYGKRLVVFAPLYFANSCVNNCLYCGFRSENHSLERKKLSTEEIREEVAALEREGHKRLLVLTGESPNTDLEYLIQAINTAYDVETENGGEIRRINVEIAPLNKEGFELLKTSKIGTYTCFQETYHRKTYEKMHPSGPKSDYDWRLSVMDRAQEAGIDDVGIGALFGLYDYRFEVVALLLHAEYLDQTYGVGPHTISIPRLNPAPGSPLEKAPYPVSDNDFRKLAAIIRLAVPYTGMILTTRESVEMRNELFIHGVSQISAGSRTSPGAYKDKGEKKQDSGEKKEEYNQKQDYDLEQFSLHDFRPIDQIITEIAEMGYIPSFCTACYRLGRTGKDFMDLAKPGKIQDFCRPNALMTFKEYLHDYGSDSSRKAGAVCIDNILNQLKKDNPKLGKKIEENLKEISKGEHDLYL